MIWSLILTFACGAAYEFGCAFWVAHTEANRVLPAVAWSVFNCLVTVVGIGESLHRPLFIGAYAAGFGTGTAMAIVLKNRPTRANRPS